MLMEEVSVFDVSILGQLYRVRAESRSKAVTQALKEFRRDHSDGSFPLSLLRLKAKTTQVDLEEENLQQVVEEKMRKRV